MKNIIQFLFASILMMSLVSCGPTLRPLTKSMYRDYGLDGKAMKKIQFYLSEDVVLYRKSTSGKSQIENGRVRMIKGQQVEEVKFPKGTPGVFMFSPDGDKIAISFDSSDENVLLFGPNPKLQNRYVILAKDWKSDQGIVEYGGERFKIRGADALAGLLLDARKLNSTEVKRTTVRGRTVR